MRSKQPLRRGVAKVKIKIRNKAEFGALVRVSQKRLSIKDAEARIRKLNEKIKKSNSIRKSLVWREI